MVHPAVGARALGGLPGRRAVEARYDRIVTRFHPCPARSRTARLVACGWLGGVIALILIALETPAHAQQHRDGAVAAVDRCGTIRVKAYETQRRARVRVQVTSGRASCRTARRVARYAMTHPGGQAGPDGPRGWTCFRGGPSQPHTPSGFGCRRRSPAAVIEGFFLRPRSSLEPSEASARDCGDPPGYFDLKAKGVSCPKAREVQRRWVEKQPGGSAEQVVKVGRFRCRGESAGESFVIRCKRKRSRATVRFQGGG